MKPEKVAVFELSPNKPEASQEATEELLSDEGKPVPDAGLQAVVYYSGSSGKQLLDLLLKASNGKIPAMLKLCGSDAEGYEITNIGDPRED